MPEVDNHLNIGFAKGTNALLHWFTAVRQEREAKLLNQMVSEVRQGRATFDSLLAGISAIAELRSTEKSMEQSLIESTELEAHHG